MMDIADHRRLSGYERIIEEKDAEIARLQAVIADLRDAEMDAACTSCGFEGSGEDMPSWLWTRRDRIAIAWRWSVGRRPRALDGEVKPLPTEINTKGSDHEHDDTSHHRPPRPVPRRRGYYWRGRRDD